MRRIECLGCDAHYCDGCNIYILATMLKQGKLDCMMDEHRTITIDPEELRPKGERKNKQTNSLFTWHLECSVCGADYHTPVGHNYCPNCGADMRGVDDAG